MPDEPATLPADSELAAQRSRPGPNADDFDPAAHRWDGLQWWTSDFAFWWDGTQWQRRGSGAVTGQPQTLSLEEQRGRPGPGQDGWDSLAHRLYGGTWWTPDAQYWWDGSKWESRHASGAPVAPMARGARGRRVFSYGDFWLGFAGTIILNIVFASAFGYLLSLAVGSDGWTAAINLAPWVLNIGALFFFALVRPRVALGMLFAYGIALALALLAGIFLAVLCFGGGGGIP